jgi:hypothetical protein
MVHVVVDGTSLRLVDRRRIDSDDNVERPTVSETIIKRRIQHPQRADSKK